MMTLDTILLASRNKHKLLELQTFLRDLPVAVLSLDDVPFIAPVEEDGRTFQENALKKARETFLGTGIPTLADDSGLEVFYLNGRPGVHSARYAGIPADDAANNRKLLAALKGVPPRRRSARFVAALAVVAKDVEEVYIGSCDGTIVEEPAGMNGFGYDPLFRPVGFERTFAQLTADEKNGISHRSRAFRAMHEYLTKLGR